MGFLLNKLHSIKQNDSLENIDTSSTFLRPYALLQEGQLDKFVRGLLKGNDNLYEKVYEKTGDKCFTKAVEGSTIYKVKRGCEDYTDLAAFEALLHGMYGWDNDIPCSFLEYGQGEFFNENGFAVKYLKEKPLYERNNSKDKNGDYRKEAGISQILYQSPIGNFIIKQNQLNNRIFELYISEDISETLMEKLSNALEISLDIKIESKEKDFHERYRVGIDNTSPDIVLQDQTHTIPPSIEDPRSEI